MSAPAGEIQIAAACDERYAMALAVMLASLSASLDPSRRAQVHVLERSLAGATKARIEQSVRRDRIAISWLPIAPERLGSLRPTLRSFDTVSLDAYSRLLIPEVLPAALTKVIYLDCDLVILRDLGLLWDLEVGDRYVLAAPELDPHARVVSARRGLRLYRELGLPRDLATCNSGVLVMNLRKWRADLLAHRVLTYLHEAGDHLRCHDQDGLNATMAGQWGELDPRWNVTMHVFRRDVAAATRARLLRDPFIVHFNSALKPWQPGFRLGFQGLFVRYLDLTAWAGWRPIEPPHPHLAHWARAGVRALRKRLHAAGYRIRAARHRLRAAIAVRGPAARLDARDLGSGRTGEIRLFVLADGDRPCLPVLLSHYLAHGVDRALVAIDPDRRDEALRLLQAHERLHLFAADLGRRSRDEVLRQLLRRYGQGHWCVVVDADELLLYPGAETLSLRDLCGHLELHGFEAMVCRVLDMAAADPGSARSDRPGADPRGAGVGLEPRCRRIRTVARDPVTLRVFAASLLIRDGCAAEDLEVCRSKVPLLKFRPGMLIADEFRAVQGLRTATVEGALLRCRDLRAGPPATPTACRPAGAAGLSATAELMRRGVMRATAELEALVQARAPAREVAATAGMADPRSAERG